MMEEGSMVRVIRDFLTLNDGELSVIKDEILQIIQVVDRHWVRCQNIRDVGLVPSSNICPIGKKHALKKYNQFALNTSCFWGNLCNFTKFLLQK